MSEQIVKGDTPTFEFTLTDDAGAAIDLTDVSTIQFIAKTSLDLPDGSAIFDKACAVVAPATGGICNVTLTAADTATVGLYRAELELRFNDGSIVTATQFLLEITDDVRTVA